MSVKILPGAGDARHLRLAAELALGADFARDARHFRGEAVELIDHRVDGVLHFQNFAAHVGGDLLGKIAPRDGGGDFGDVADLAGQVRGHEVDVVGQVLPGTGDAGHRGLTAELALGADLARHARHLGGEAVELIDHRVDRVLQRENLALHVDGDLARQIAPRDRGRHVGDVADLAGQVRSHGIHRVGQVLPGAGDARHLGLAAELAFGADLARHARHFRRKAVELVDHRVDGFLQLQDFALGVDGDLAREIAARDGGRHGRDVADLLREVGRHGVDGIRQVLPRAGDARHDRLAAEAPVGADLARHARHFGGKRPELVDHRVDGFLELQDLAAHVDGDLLGKVAVGDGDGDVGDVADLRREVAGHLVDRLGQFLPDARHALDLGLAAELALGADFARHAGHFRGEDRKLLDHRVDELRGAQEFALERPPVDLQFHGLPEVAFRHRTDRTRHFGRRPHQIVQQRVDGIDFLGPSADRPGQRHALLEPSLLADRDAQARHFAGDAALVGKALVERLGDPAVHARPIRRQAHRKVAVAKSHHGHEKLTRPRCGGIVTSAVAVVEVEENFLRVEVAVELLMASPSRSWRKVSGV